MGKTFTRNNIKYTSTSRSAQGCNQKILEEFLLPLHYSCIVQRKGDVLKNKNDKRITYWKAKICSFKKYKGEFIHI